MSSNQSTAAVRPTSCSGFSCCAACVSCVAAKSIDDGRQAHTVSTMSASEVHPQEFVGVRVPGTLDVHGFKRVGYWQNVIVRTVGSSRSDLAAKTLKVADLQPHQLKIADSRC